MPEVVHTCIKIRRSKRVRTPDATIAATAIAHDLTLLTADKGFESINGLKVLNPYELKMP